MKVICQLSKEAGEDYPKKMGKTKEQFIEDMKQIVARRLQLRPEKDIVEVQFVEKEQKIKHVNNRYDDALEESFVKNQKSFLKGEGFL